MKRNEHRKAGSHDQSNETLQSTSSTLKPTRRTFLCGVPAAAAAISFPLAEGFFPATASAQVFSPQPVQLLSAEKIAATFAKLDAAPGNDNVFGTNVLPFTIALTIEKKKSDRQFEYHEGRDHLFQILDGSTVYEVGGTPQNGHSEKPGEWHAPTSIGTATYTLHKGDMILIPRGTPHRRTTEKSVSFMLVSTVGVLKT